MCHKHREEHRRNEVLEFMRSTLLPPLLRTLEVEFHGFWETEKSFRIRKYALKCSKTRSRSGIKSLQHGLREPLLRVRADLCYHLDQASAHSLFLKQVLRRLAKTTSLGVFWCSAFIVFDFKITKSALKLSGGECAGIQAVWLVYTKGKQVPWTNERDLPARCEDRAQKPRFSRR